MWWRRRSSGQRTRLFLTIRVRILLKSAFFCVKMFSKKTENKQRQASVSPFKIENIATSMLTYLQ